MKKKVIIIGFAAVLGACAGHQLRQPRMHRALELLRGARLDLEHATADKGSHRITAIEQVDLAIAEVKSSLENDD
jgi:hypothetical protein